MFMVFKISGCGIAADRRSQIGGSILSWEIFIGLDNNPTRFLHQHNHPRVYFLTDTDDLGVQLFEEVKEGKKRIFIKIIKN